MKCVRCKKGVGWVRNYYDYADYVTHGEWAKSKVPVCEECHTLRLCLNETEATFLKKLEGK